MLSNRVAFALLAASCVAAAAGGSYLATRQNARTEAPAAPSASLSPAETPAPATSVAKPLQETEAVVGEASPARPASAASAPNAAAAVGRRRDEAPKARDTATRPPARPRSAEATTARNDQLPALDRGWPTSTPAAAPAAPAPGTAAPVVEAPAPVPQAEESTAPEPPKAPEPQAPAVEELVISADSVIGLQVETTHSSETARVEERVDARVVRDVRVGGSVAIPAGSRALGSVMVVERGGKFKERARLGIRFHTLVLADGTQLPVTTETIYRDGEARGQASTAKIGGGAVVGAILGAIAGGAKGAAIGASAGAGAGTASVATGDRSAATLLSGTELTARILAPVTVTVEK